MSAGPPPPPGSSRARMLAAAALALYPAAWRARYGEEVRAQLADSGAGPRTVTSLAWRAIPAWIWPPRHLHDRPARIRASLSTVLLAWTALAGLALVFTQLTQAQPTLQGLPPGRPVIQWSYWVFDRAILVSVLAVAGGGLPLWLQMMRAARHQHRRRDTTYLLSPVIVPAAYLTAMIITVSLVRHPARPAVSPRLNSVIDLANGGIGPWWFLTLAVLGLAAAGISAAGPALALRRLRPAGRAAGRAASAAGLASAAIGLASAASIIAAAGLYLQAPRYAGYDHAWPLGIYLPLVLLPAATAIISARRGIQATRSPAAT